MKYSILIYNSPADFAMIHGPQTAQTGEFWASWPVLMQAATEAGILLGGNGLLPPSTATTVKFAGDKARVQDGPYADTKEQLGGFVNLDVPDLDSALAWVARIPRLPDPVCEVRPQLAPPGQ